MNVPTVAVNVLGPAMPPSVHEPTVAMPCALVVAFAPFTTPPPDAIAKSTAAFGTGLPPTSFTITLAAMGRAVPATAVCRSPAFFVIDAGGPAAMVTVAPAVTDPAVAVMVTEPTVPPRVTSVDTCPFAPVVAAAGLNDAPLADAVHVTN